MKRVIIESPLKGDKGDYTMNRVYARLCMRDSPQRGEAPFASHLLYARPGILNDEDPSEREIGMNAGFAWGVVAELVAVYIDRGISSGMLAGIRRANANNVPIAYRSLGFDYLSIEMRTTHESGSETHETTRADG